MGNYLLPSVFLRGGERQRKNALKKVPPDAKHPAANGIYGFLFQESFDNDFFRFLFVHAEGHQLQQLVVVDSSDGGFVHHLGVGIVGFNGGN